MILAAGFVYDINIQYVPDMTLQSNNSLIFRNKYKQPSMF